MAEEFTILLNTVGAKHLISKKKLEEKGTKTKAEKVIFTVLMGPAVINMIEGGS